jgi:hypothetical protein
MLVLAASSVRVGSEGLNQPLRPNAPPPLFMPLSAQCLHCRTPGPMRWALHYWKSKVEHTRMSHHNSQHRHVRTKTALTAYFLATAIFTANIN